MAGGGGILQGDLIFLNNKVVPRHKQPPEVPWAHIQRKRTISFFVRASVKAACIWGTSLLAYRSSGS